MLGSRRFDDTSISFVSSIAEGSLEPSAVPFSAELTESYNDDWVKIRSL